MEQRVESLESSREEMTEALRILVDTQERIITGQEQMVSTLRAIESTLNEHTRILNIHTERLTEHGRLLGSVVATLQDHSSRLAVIESYLSNQ